MCGEINNKDEDDSFGVPGKIKCTVRLCTHVSMSELRSLYISLVLVVICPSPFASLPAPPSIRSWCFVCFVGPMKNTKCNECCCVCICVAVKKLWSARVSFLEPWEEATSDRDNHTRDHISLRDRV